MMTTTTGPDVLGAKEIGERLERHGLDARRSLGQNFVADPHTVVHIARLAEVGPGDHVIEVGPGLGSLTLALADTGAEVLALEKDTSLLGVLAEVLVDHRATGVEVVEADALELDWDELLATRGGPDVSRVLVANLPYNVAVPIVMAVLEQVPSVDRLVVLVQKEVAERLCAAPGGRTVGIPSMRVAWYAAARVLSTVPPEVFVPRPRVTSAVIGLTRRPPPSTSVTVTQVMTLVERAYTQRRKMLRSTLGPTVPPAAFLAAGVAPTDRPEQLDIADWARLAEELHRTGSVGP
jgi:16S rRNA (adenine1518-N6/adenine1519-N6)-dimethyltransferase